MFTSQYRGTFWSEGKLVIAVEQAQELQVISILEEVPFIHYDILWQSKYNSYVRYDYEPDRLGSFIPNFIVEGTDCKLRYIKHRVEELFKTVDTLEKCWWTIYLG